MPCKENNREFKRMYKPWVTEGILNSIKRKDRLYKKYVKSKNNIFNDNLHEEYVLWNQINELIRLSEKNYFTKFFSEYSNNIKKVWQGIKEIVNLKIPIHLLLLK